MKSVCKENFKGYFSLHRQSSCMKYKLVHTYFTKNYAQDNYFILDSVNHLPSGEVLADLALIFY